MSAVLVSPLGKSPGAVSGVYFGLEQEGIQITQVITIGTRDPGVTSAANDYLRKIFRHEAVEYTPMSVKEDDLRAPKDEVFVLVERIRLALQKANATSLDVYVAVTGGRSGMGALTLMMAQLYGAKEILHLRVDSEIEFGGSVDQLTNLVSVGAMLKSPYLDPTLWGDDAWDLVRLPFLDLQSLLPVTQDFSQVGQWPDFSNPLLSLLLLSNAQKFTDIFSPKMTFGMVEEIFALKTEYDRADPYGREDIIAKLEYLLKETGYTEAEIAENKKIVRSQELPGLPSEELAMQPPSELHALWVWFLSNRGELKDLAAIGGFFLNLAKYSQDYFNF